MYEQGGRVDNKFLLCDGFAHRRPPNGVQEAIEKTIPVEHGAIGSKEATKGGRSI